MNASLGTHLQEQSVWRRLFTLRLKLLSEWLTNTGLMDDGVRNSLRLLETRAQAERIVVAFVAEYSRGKSELINALLFSSYGSRIMPSSVGRTTMCPTEVGYDAAHPPQLQLLPIETRLRLIDLSEWRAHPEQWQTWPLDMADPAQLSQCLMRVSETQRVPLEQAQALRLWQPDAQDNPLPDAEGLVEVPRWRHAVVNIPHPLLEQGLVVLDTPGLNAVGTEPAITLNMIPQAHVVVFMLGVDTGVTRSDLTLWQEFLAPPAGADNRLVVLNKIDTLWDAFSSPAEIARQIERQRASAASMLGVDTERVMALSARKALEGGVQANALVLAQSGINNLQVALGQGVVARRQHILAAAVAREVENLRADAARTLALRQRNLQEQADELESLRGKNATVIGALRVRIEKEHTHFGESVAQVRALRIVQTRLLREALALLAPDAVKAATLDVARMLRRSGLKTGLREVYAKAFANLLSNLESAQEKASELTAELIPVHGQLNDLYGFRLPLLIAPDLSAYVSELATIEHDYMRRVNLGESLKLVSSRYALQVGRALLMRLRPVFESAAGDLQSWGEAAGAAVDAQLRERHRHFTSRIQAIDRIQGAADNLSDRLAELDDALAAGESAQERLLALTQQLVIVPDAAPQDPPSQAPTPAAAPAS